MGLSEAVKEITIPKIILLIVLIFVLYGVLDYYFDLYNKLETEQNIRTLTNIKKNTTNPDVIKEVDLKFKEIVANMKPRRDKVVFVNYLMIFSLLPLMYMLHSITRKKDESITAIYHHILFPFIIFVAGLGMYYIYYEYLNLHLSIRYEIWILMLIFFLQYLLSIYIGKFFNWVSNKFNNSKGEKNPKKQII